MSEYRHIANLKGERGDQGPPGVGSHGVPSGPIDLDELRTSDDMGTYTTVGRDLLNGPPIPENRLITLEVIWNVSNGVTQRVTAADGIWYRNANSATTFASWKREVISEEVGQIVVSKNAERSLEDGDLLVLLDTPSYFTDFTGSQMGEPPEGWTPRWASSDHSIERDSKASNGLVLSHPGGSGTGRRALSWDLLDNVDQAGMTKEIVFKWRGSTDAQPRAVLEGSGEAGSETGVTGGIESSRQGSLVLTYDEGSTAVYRSGVVDAAHAEGEWWTTRLRFEPGGRAFVRAWKWGTPEPATWSRVAFEPGNFEEGPGWTGLLTFGSGWTQYDWVGVAFDGGRAPVGG